MRKICLSTLLTIFKNFEILSLFFNKISFLISSNEFVIFNFPLFIICFPKFKVLPAKSITIFLSSSISIGAVIDIPPSSVIVSSSVLLASSNASFNVY